MGNSSQIKSQIFTTEMIFRNIHHITLSMLLAHSQWGPQHQSPQVSTCDSSSTEVSRVGQATYSEGGLDIASNSDLGGTKWQVDVARLGGHVPPWEVWRHVQRVSCDDEWLGPAQERNLSERRRLWSAYGPANGSWLYDIGISVT